MCKIEKEVNAKEEDIKLWKDEILKDEYLYISKRLEKILNIWNY